MPVEQLDPQTQLEAHSAPAGTQLYRAMAYAKADPNVRANMRASTRWDYTCEYAGYFIDYYRFLLFAVALVAGGILLLGAFWPIGLLMIMLGAKYKNMSWWDDFIVRKFGKNRSVIQFN
ncbi:hypothetical protein H0O03_03370 [Candidatus Micrarchaeota archaeon]|nr:hypothetical protein [Candidatus Micrarchaeota archaeon]